MSWLEGLFNPHLENVQQALNRTSRRQGLLMANMANVNTPGYKRQDLDFNIELERKIGHARNLGEFLSKRDRQQEENQSIRYDGNNVDLEREVMAITETQMRYQILTQIASRSFSGLKDAIAEGKR